MLLGFLFCARAYSANIEVTGPQINATTGPTDFVGTTAIVSGGGSSSNFQSNVNVNDFAVFDMQKDGADYADLVITLDSITNADNKLMLVQTENSQGLTDDGTISFLMDVTGNSGGTMEFSFDWYTPGSFVGGVEQTGSSLLTDQIKYTSLDIDFSQEVGIATSQLDSTTTYNALNGDPSSLTITDDGTTWARDAGANSSFDDPENAVSFLTKAGISASHTITMGKQDSDGNALFMFEFRDPPVIVPEPGTLALAGILLGSFGGLHLLKRRKR